METKKAIVAGIVCVLALVWNVDARAQAVADTVILQDGTLVRGTIVELHPNEYVVIQTATGETRRFEAASVRNAGPSDRAPTAAMGGDTPAPAPAPYALAPAIPPAPMPPANGELPIRIVDDGDGLTLRLQTGVAYGMSGQYAVSIVTYRSICTAPCVGNIPGGAQQFAVMNARGRDYGVRGTVAIEPGSELLIGIESRRRARGITAGVGAILMLGGFVTMGVRIGRGYDFLDGGVTAGYAVGAAGLLIGVFGLLFIKDRGRVTVRPASPLF